MNKFEENEKIPCGRTEEDKHLCCRRNHKWYNTRLVIDGIRICRNPIKCKQIFRESGSAYCRVCGSQIELFSGLSLRETIFDWLFGPFI